jgi:hypothetical protein
LIREAKEDKRYVTQIVRNDLAPKETSEMTDAQVEGWMRDARTQYHQGALAAWKIKRLEKISGWTWGEKEEVLASA